ncbi:hypothetical protein CDL12_05874 [Handroanthus impetiginosus]|uniref:Senescence regulator S40 n=1 Tax=Handroanthus impetiginosus TaxID=429701 RepID=A0A2G9HV54_9LAMI|nr:hypothetical protein CDL12_05874 [Handroanthus impetiginosus]
MDNNNPSSSSSNPTPIELHESDVVWSFSPSFRPRSLCSSTASSPSPLHQRRRRFNPIRSGLSVALIDDRGLLIRRKSRINHAGARPQNIPVKFRHSAPVNIPMRRRKPRENYYNNGNRISINDLRMFDELEDQNEVKKEEEMVPPHVMVARSHVTFSVFEGVGRTLKGRDLLRVRNAVFKKTGFID